MAEIESGRIRLRGVSRTFRVLHERNLTLKETALRRRRLDATTRWAVRDVDLEVEPGEAVGIIGQNGSGKSTLLKMLAQIIPPTTGTVEIGGSVAAMLELGAGFHPDFTGRENVFMNGSIHGLSEKQIAGRLDEIVDFAELHEFIDMPVRTYSSGMQMRLAFAISSHVNPDVLLLDEVLAVGDEAFQRKCYSRIFEFRRGGGTLVFVSHDPGAVERVCDRAILLEDGVVVAAGPTEDVLRTYHRHLASAPDIETPVEVGTRQDAMGDDEDPRVWGTRDVAVISEARLLGANGPTDRFVAGDALTVEIDIDAREPILRPNVGVAIVSNDGTLCCGSNTRRDGFTVEEINGRATFRCHIPSLHLHEGRFTVTVALESADELTTYHWLDRWLEFSVFARNTGVGLVEAEMDWQLETEAPAEVPS